MGILGPVTATDADVTLDLGRPMHGAVLALLAVHHGRVVTVDHAVDALWGDDPPETARGSLQAHVSRLRRALGPHASSVVTERPGYALRVPTEAVDARRFEELLGAGRDAALDGRPDDAAAQLHAALALWRGPALADVDVPFAAPVAARLDQLRVVAEEDLLEVDLALGRHREVVPRGEALVATHPLRERAWAALILGLYRSGRAADALGTYRRLHQQLLEELGIDPSPELQALELAIIRNDPALALEPVPPGPDRRAPVDAARPVARSASAVVVPPVRYATAPDGVHVAYQELGEGPVDLLVSQSYVWQCEVAWEHEPATRLWRALAERGRVLLYDKRGQGLSDRVRIESLPQRALDVTAVLDAAGSDRAVVIGNSDGSFVTGQAAATDPRVVGFVSISGGLSMYSPDRPWAPDLEGFLAWSRWLSTRWGTGRSLRALAPSWADDPVTVAWMGRLERAACGPGELLQLLHTQSDLDWTETARTLRVPALVVRRADETVAAECCRELADTIGARYLEVPGDEHLMYLGDHEPIVEAIDELLALVAGSGQRACLD